eukprot:15440379-Alexandrium_andersonii.AAC.1
MAPAPRSDQCSSWAGTITRSPDPLAKAGFLAESPARGGRGPRRSKLELRGSRTDFTFHPTRPRPG